MDEKNTAIPEGEENKKESEAEAGIGLSEADKEELKKAFSDLGKSLGDATKVMMEGFSALFSGLAESMSEIKFGSFSDLLGGADGDWRCELLGLSVNISEPTLRIAADGKDAVEYGCSVEVNDNGSKVVSDAKFGVIEYFDYYAPKLLDNGNIAAEYLLGVVGEDGDIKHSIRFERVKKSEDNTRTEAEN